MTENLYRKDKYSHELKMLNHLLNGWFLWEIEPLETTFLAFLQDVQTPVNRYAFEGRRRFWK